MFEMVLQCYYWIGRNDGAGTAAILVERANENIAGVSVAFCVGESGNTRDIIAEAKKVRTIDVTGNQPLADFLGEVAEFIGKPVDLFSLVADYAANEIKEDRLTEEQAIEIFAKILREFISE